MKYSKSLLVIMMALSWLTMPMLGRKDFKRFLPASLFISIVVLIVNAIAKERKWWWWYEKLHPKLNGIFPFLWGPFFISSFWTLKLTYGKFLQYMMLNLNIHSMFSFIVTNFLKKFGIASLVRLKKPQLIMLLSIQALLLYGFQYIKENVQTRFYEEK